MRSANPLYFPAPVLLCVALALCGPLSAQNTAAGVLEGHVLDSISGHPIAGVLIRLDSGGETHSHADGRFRFEGVPPGSHMIALLSADCRVTWSDVEVEPGETVSVELRIRFPVGMAARQVLDVAEDRRSEGTLVTAAEIEEMAAKTLEDVIRRVQPRMIGPPGNMAGEFTAVTRRSRTFTDGGGGEPVVLIDGVRATDGARSLALIHPSDVETLELLPSAAAGWEFGSSGSGGVIRVTTRRYTAARGGAPRPVEAIGSPAPGASGSDDRGCVVPGFPGR